MSNYQQALLAQTAVASVFSIAQSCSEMELNIGGVVEALTELAELLPPDEADEARALAEEINGY